MVTGKNKLPVVKIIEVRRDLEINFKKKCGS
jgi:hypothetical protein